MKLKPTRATKFDTITDKRVLALANLVAKQRNFSDEEKRDQLQKIAYAAKNNQSGEWIAMGSDVVKMVETHLPYVNPIPNFADVQEGLGWDEQVKWDTVPGLRAWILADGVSPTETKISLTRTEFPDFEIHAFPTLRIKDLENGKGPTPDMVAAWSTQALMSQLLGYLYNLLVVSVADGSANTNETTTEISKPSFDAGIDYLWPIIGKRPAGIIGPQSSFTPVTGFDYGYSIQTLTKIYETQGMLESYRAIPFVELIQPQDEDGVALKNDVGTELLPITAPYNMFLAGTNFQIGGIKFAQKGGISVYDWEDMRELLRGWHFVMKVSLGVIEPSKTLFRYKINAA